MPLNNYGSYYLDCEVDIGQDSSTRSSRSSGGRDDDGIICYPQTGTGDTNYCPYVEGYEHHIVGDNIMLHNFEICNSSDSTEVGNMFTPSEIRGKITFLEFSSAN